MDILLEHTRMVGEINTMRIGNKYKILLIPANGYNGIFIHCIASRRKKYEGRIIRDPF